jgi:hypothetical protein
MGRPTVKGGQPQCREHYGRLRMNGSCPQEASNRLDHRHRS